MGHPKAGALSNVQIAEHCGVSEFLVRKVQGKTTSIKSKSPTRTGRDGRTINVSNIGKTRHRPAVPPNSEPDEADWTADVPVEQEPEPDTAAAPEPRGQRNIGAGKAQERRRAKEVRKQIAEMSRMSRSFQTAFEDLRAEVENARQTRYAETSRAAITSCLEILAGIISGDEA